MAPSVGPTRTEEDFVGHMARTMARDPAAAWIFIVDRLNTHQSASLVHLVAKPCGIEEDVGVKGKAGIVESRPTRAAFLQDPTHRIRFVYTPKHTSWLNQVEIWFSLLVRRLLKRASFTSVDELREQLIAFIDDFNKTMATPFRWTSAGRPLVLRHWQLKQEKNLRQAVLVEVSLADALTLADRLNIYADDAYMLACAQQQRCPLLSLDRGLLQAARSLGVEILQV